MCLFCCFVQDFSVEFFFFFFWFVFGCACGMQHAEVLGPGIKPVPQQ